MDRLKLGNTDLLIAPIVFGGNVFGWTIDEQQSFSILDAFVEKGFNMIDTADVYSHWAPGNSGGESETIIGNWLKKTGKRHQVVIATKVGGATKDQPKPNTAKSYILKEVETSLKRLQIETIDLYQTHFDDESIPVQETLEAYDRLIKDGKVRWIGASNLSAERLEESLKLSAEWDLPAYQTLQPEYNLVQRKKYELEYEPIVVRNNLGVITYYSLASGFLTGKYRSDADLNKSARGEGVKKMLDKKGLSILSVLDNIAAEHNTSQAAVALAWLLARPSVTAPIVSATSIEQMKSMTDAVKLKLNESDIEHLNEVSMY